MCKHTTPHKSHACVQSLELLGSIKNEARSGLYIYFEKLDCPNSSDLTSTTSHPTYPILAPQVLQRAHVLGIHLCTGTVASEQSQALCQMRSEQHTHLGKPSLTPATKCREFESLAENSPNDAICTAALQA